MSHALAGGFFTVSATWEACSVVQLLIKSNSLWSHGLQHARPPCPSQPPRACSNSCPSSQWCHPTISSSVVPFSSHLQSFPASGSFPMIWPFTSTGQSTGTSASASVLPMNIQNWCHLGWTGWISLWFKELLRAFSNPQFKSINLLVLSFLYSIILTSVHDYGKNHSFDYIVKVMSLLFTMLSRFVIVSPSRSKYLLIHDCSHHLQWFWSPRK